MGLEVTAQGEHVDRRRAQRTEEGCSDKGEVRGYSKEGIAGAERGNPAVLEAEGVFLGDWKMGTRNQPCPVAARSKLSLTSGRALGKKEPERDE